MLHHHLEEKYHGSFIFSILLQTNLLAHCDLYNINFSWHMNLCLLTNFQCYFNNEISNMTICTGYCDYNISEKLYSTTRVLFDHKGAMPGLTKF